MTNQPDQNLPWEDLPKGHRFFLNPYDDFAFTKCPKCDQKTAVRKFPLVIHIEPAKHGAASAGRRHLYCASQDSNEDGRAAVP